MNLGDVMDELAEAVDTISGLRVTGYYPGTISPPSGWVDLPQSYTFDQTFGRGLDSMILEVWVAVTMLDHRTARNAITPYLAGSGASSVKAAIEGYTPTAYHSARVERAEFNVISVGGQDYLAATFMVNVTGSGT